MCCCLLWPSCTTNQAGLMRMLQQESGLDRRVELQRKVILIIPSLAEADRFMQTIIFLEFLPRVGIYSHEKRYIHSGFWYTLQGQKKPILSAIFYICSCFEDGHVSRGAFKDRDARSRGMPQEPLPSAVAVSNLSRACLFVRRPGENLQMVEVFLLGSSLFWSFHKAVRCWISEILLNKTQNRNMKWLSV